MVEFALVVPVLMIMLVAVGDFGRLYVSAVAVESAAREAADFGAFRSINGCAANVTVTTDQMNGAPVWRRRGATRGIRRRGRWLLLRQPQLHLQPGVERKLGRLRQLGWVRGRDRLRDGDDSTTCIVHVRLDYDFDMILSFPGLPDTVALARESRSHAGPDAVMRRVRSKRRSRGQALVEFAFVVPIFLLLMFAIIDFGRYVYYVQVINNAAREGTRYAIVHGGKGRVGSRDRSRSSDASGERVKAVVRNYAIGVIGSAADLDIHRRGPMA